MGRSICGFARRFFTFGTFVNGFAHGDLDHQIEEANDDQDGTARDFSLEVYKRGAKLVGGEYSHNDTTKVTPMNTEELDLTEGKEQEDLQPARTFAIVWAAMTSLARRQAEKRVGTGGNL